MTAHPPPTFIAGLAPFDYKPRTRLVFGTGSINQVGTLAAGLGGSRVLLVTDKGIVQAGHADSVMSLLRGAGLEVACFDAVEENPSTRCVRNCVQVAADFRADLLIGLGGGSSMDTAKGCNFLLTNGGEMRDYLGIGKATKPMLPLIAIPTTGGTGSESQSFALITDEQTHQKMACGDPKAAARIALLDPSLTVTQPRSVTACTGIDAISHAVETAVTRKRSPLSILFSREAFRLMMRGFPRVLWDPNDLEARGLMLLGATFAGTAIENSMLGAAHSAANPLTAHRGLVHGVAVGLMLPEVVRFNGSDPTAAQGYADLLVSSGMFSGNGSLANPAETLAEQLESLLESAGFPANLARAGVLSENIPTMADEAAKQWTATFNPRPITAPDFGELYQCALIRSRTRRAP